MGKLKTKFLDWLFEGYNNEFLANAKDCLDAADSCIEHAKKCIESNKDSLNFAGKVIDTNDKLAAKNNELLETSENMLADMKKMHKGYRLVIRQHMILISAVKEHQDSEAIFNRFASMLADDLMEAEAGGASNNDESTENAE